MTVPYLYEFDHTAANPSNLISNEPHSVVINESKLITLDHGCFYTEGLVIEINSPPYTPLVLNTDYFFRGFEPNLTAMSGHEAASAIYFPTYTGNIRITYQVVGGADSFNSIIRKNIADAITANNNLPIDWNTIGNKPTVYPQDPHTHSVLDDLNDLYRLSEKMEGIREALVGKRSVLHSNQELSDKINRLLYIIAEFKRRVDSAITLSNSNVSGKEDIVNKITDLLNPGNIDNDKYPTTEAVIEYITYTLTESGVIPSEPIPYERGIQYTTEDSLKRIIKDDEIYRLNDLGQSSKGTTFTATTGLWEEGSEDYPWFSTGTGTNVTYSEEQTTLETASVISIGQEVLQESVRIISDPLFTLQDIWDYTAPFVTYTNVTASTARKVKILSHFNSATGVNVYNSEADTLVNTFWSTSNYTLTTVNGINSFSNYLKCDLSSNSSSYIATNIGTNALNKLAELSLTNGWTVDFHRYFVAPPAGKKQSLCTIQKLSTFTRSRYDLQFYIDSANIGIIVLGLSDATAEYVETIPLINFVSGGYNNELLNPLTALMNSEVGWTHIQIMARVVTPGSNIRLSIAINGKIFESTTNFYSYLSSGFNLPNNYPQKIFMGRSYIPGTGNVHSETFDPTKFIAFDEFRWTEGNRNTTDFISPTKPGIYENITSTSRTASVPFKPLYFKMAHSDSLPSLGSSIRIGYSDNSGNSGIYITFTKDGSSLKLTGSYVVSGAVTALPDVLISGAESNCWKRESLIWLDSNNDNGSNDARICYGYIDTVSKQVIIKYVSNSITNLRTLINFSKVTLFTNQIDLIFDWYEPEKLSPKFNGITPEMCFAEIPEDTIVDGSTSEYDGISTRKSIIYFTDCLKIMEIEGDGKYFELDMLDSENVVFNNADHPASNLTSKRVESAILELETKLQEVIGEVYDIAIPYQRGLQYTIADTKKAIIRNNKYYYLPNEIDLPFTTSGSWNGGDSGFPLWIGGNENSSILNGGTEWNSGLYDDEIIKAYTDGNIKKDDIYKTITVTAITDTEETWVLSNFTRVAAYNRDETIATNGAGKNDVGGLLTFWLPLRISGGFSDNYYDFEDTPNLLSQRILRHNKYNDQYPLGTSAVLNAADYVNNFAGLINSPDSLVSWDDETSWNGLVSDISTTNLVGDKGSKFPNLHLVTEWFISFRVVRIYNDGHGILECKDGSNVQGLNIKVIGGKLEVKIRSDKPGNPQYTIDTGATLSYDGERTTFSLSYKYSASNDSSTITFFKRGYRYKTFTFVGKIMNIGAGGSGKALLFISDGIRSNGLMLDGFKVNLNKSYHGTWAEDSERFPDVSPSSNVPNSYYVTTDAFPVLRFHYKNTPDLTIPSLGKFINLGYKNKINNKKVYLKFINTAGTISVETRTYDGITDSIVGSSSIFSDNLKSKDWSFFIRNESVGTQNRLCIDDIGITPNALPIYQSSAIASLNTYFDTDENEFFIETDMNNLIANLWNGTADGIKFLLQDIPNNTLSVASTNYRFTPYRILLPEDRNKFYIANRNAEDLIFDNSGSDLSSENTEAAIKEVNTKVNRLTGIRASNIPKRQTVLNGPLHSVSYTPLLFSNTGLLVYNNVAAETTPIKLTFGDGFDEYGAIDYVYNVVWDGTSQYIFNTTVPDNTTSYLYFDLNLDTKTVTFGSTTVKPVYSISKPTPVSNQYWYPTDHRSRGEYYNGSIWVPVLRIFVGHAVASAGVVTLTSYAYQGKYYQRHPTTVTWPLASTAGGWGRYFIDNIFAGPTNKRVNLFYEFSGTVPAGFVTGDIVDLYSLNNSRTAPNDNTMTQTVKLTSNGIEVAYHQTAHVKTFQLMAYTSDGTNGNSVSIAGQVGYLIAEIERSF